MVERVITMPCGFISRDGKTRIHAQLWTTESWGMGLDISSPGPKGVVQIVHGMAEHIDRYSHFARHLVHEGYVVCAEDHIGHGLSAANEDELGHIPIRDGKEFLVADVHTLYCRIQRCFPDAPYFIYGHSMGSLIARSYIAQYGEQLAGCVLAGTANGPLLPARLGETLAHMIASVRGEMHKSKLFDNLAMGSYAKAIPDPRTPLDWLSTDPNMVSDYINDALSGQLFTVGGYATLLSLLQEVASSTWAAQVPNDLPVLFIAGSEDPVGQKGKGVEAAVSLLREGGHDNVDLRIYEGLRHELHSEPSREGIYDFVVQWMDGIIDGRSHLEDSHR